MNLTEFNVWLDVVFTALYAVVIVALIVHFAFDVITGRFRKKWIDGQWPEHDHAVPAMPKVLHFVHMACILLLAFSGMYIRFPFFEGGRIAMRWVHYVAMIVVCVVLLWRIWYAFFSKNKDWREFAVRRKDMASLIAVAKFYAYLSNYKPHTAKYNVMQKLVYNVFLYLMFLQAFTGFALVTAPFIFGYSPRDLLVGWWLGALLGSADLAGWWARIAHYVINWLFIIMVTAHVYLSATVDIPCTLDFFGIRKLKVTGGHGHEEHAAPAGVAMAEAE
ncbi:MAG: cytochrome b/b6 domain-containing protein [Coriobacteriia bacterium]|nr:cytochrome b/b6 domain-containing protein [Coriobacteriia bacterium]